MDICFVTNQTLNQVIESDLSKISDSDVVVFGFNGLGLVSYKKELSGITEYFHDLALTSKQLSSVVICGCDTDNYGVYRHSVVVADKGKLLGVTDMAHSIDQSEYAAGGSLRVYDTGAGKIGLIILEDLFFPETARVLTLCDADIIICLFKKLENSMPQIFLRSGAFSNGVAMAMCAKNYACVSDIRGNITLASSADIVKAKIKIEKDYHLISSRRRGLYRDFNSGY
jgi:hypothetical protein